MADINSGGTGSGNPAGEPRFFEDRLRGASGGSFAGDAGGELEKFIRTSGKAKSALRDLQGMMTGEGKDRITTFTTSLKKMNDRLETTVKLLKQTSDLGGKLPSGIGGGAGVGAGASNGGDWVMPAGANAAPNGGAAAGAVGAAAGTRLAAGQTAMGGAGWGAVGASGGSGIAAGLTAGALASRAWNSPGVRAGALFAVTGAGAVATAGFSGSQMLEGRRDMGGFQDSLVRQSALAGGSYSSWSRQYDNMIGQGSYGGLNAFASAEEALRSMGIGRGTDTHTRLLQGVGSLGHALPGADRGQLGSAAGTMQHGQVAAGLRQRGITTFSQSTPEQMRSVLRAAAGGREATTELLNLARPGTMYYDNLMALLGDDPVLVGTVLEFGRADAQGRARGVDVTTRSGARSVFGRSVVGEENAAQDARARNEVTGRLQDLSGNLIDSSNSAEQFADNMNEASGLLGGLSSKLRDAIESFGSGFRGLSETVQSVGPAAGVAAYATYRAGRAALTRTGAGAAIRSAAGTARTGIGLGGLAARSAVGGFVQGASEAARSGGGWGRVASGAGRVLGPIGVGLAAREQFQDTRRVFDEYYDEIENDEWISEAEGFTGWRRRNLTDFANSLLFNDDRPEPAGHGSMDADIVPIDAIRGGDHDHEGYRRPHSFGGVKEHVRRAGNYIAQKFGPFPGGIGGVGSRSGKSDHPRGLALDFMTMRNSALGDRVSKYMTDNAAHFGVKYVIWKQKINSLDGRGWRQMEDRGSPTANHMDHPHVSFHSDASNAASADPGEDSSGGEGMATGTSRAGGSAMGGWSGSQDELDIFNAFFGGSHAGAMSFPGSSEGSANRLGDLDFRGASGGAGHGASLSDQQLMGILQQAGFTGQGLVTAFAVAKAESGGNAGAHNPNSQTGDNSYGLFQINMLGSMGPARRRQFGLNSNEDLWDPLTNARIAYQMSNGGSSWRHWSVHPESRGRGAAGTGYERHLSTAQNLLGSGGTVEPAGGLDDASLASVMSDNPTSNTLGAVGAASSVGPSMSRGGKTNVNVTFRIERATYDEAEKFAGWVMDVINQRSDLSNVGGN